VLEHKSEAVNRPDGAIEGQRAAQDQLRK